MQFQSTLPAQNLQPAAPSIGGRLYGEITMYPVNTVPPGWLVCNGQAINRLTYANLFANIGVAWGAGDGSTTFNVPNLAARTMIHQGSTSYAGYGFGAVGGEDYHVLSGNELAAHDHSTWTYGDDRDHAHGISFAHNNVVYYPGSSITGAGGSSWPITGIAGAGDAAVGGRTTGHLHQIPSAGGNWGHNTMQPYAVMNAIIYSGV